MVKASAFRPSLRAAFLHTLIDELDRFEADAAIENLIDEAKLELELRDDL
jgi:hypothetical protein